jgi:hypothetical protein
MHALDPDILWNNIILQPGSQRELAVLIHSNPKAINGIPDSICFISEVKSID